MHAVRLRRPRRSSFCSLCDDCCRCPARSRSMRSVSALNERSLKYRPPCSKVCSHGPGGLPTEVGGFEIGLDKANAGTRHHLVQRPATCAPIAVRVDKSGRPSPIRRCRDGSGNRRAIRPLRSGRLPLGDPAALLRLHVARLGDLRRRAPRSHFSLAASRSGLAFASASAQIDLSRFLSAPVNAIAASATSTSRMPPDAGRRDVALARRPHR